MHLLLTRPLFGPFSKCTVLISSLSGGEGDCAHQAIISLDKENTELHCNKQSWHYSLAFIH